MITLDEVVRITNGTADLGDRGEESITGVAPADNAGPGQLTFLASPKYRRQLAESSASAVLIRSADIDHCPASVLAIVVDDPYLAYAQISGYFDLTPRLKGVHPTACIDETAKLGRDVAVGANAVIGPGVILADQVEVGHGVVIDEQVTVGARTRINANVTVRHRCELGSDCLVQSGTVIGSNGFGYAPNGTRWTPIAQTGRVIIGDRVEIGANCTIDRGALDDTRIADDVIIDNLVQVAHNVRIGAGSAMAAQVGIAGSTTIGASCTIGGQSGLAGHITIADNSHFTGQAMITKGTREPGLYSSGLPATSNRDWRKMVARLRQLESLHKRVQELENKLSGDSAE